MFSARIPLAVILVLSLRLPAKQTRKFDHLIAVPLLVQSLAHDALDIPGAEGVVRAMETAR